MDTGYYLIDSGDIQTLEALIQQNLAPADVPFAADIQMNVPVYDIPLLDLADPELLAEWARVLRSGAGVICLKRAAADTDPVDRATDVLQRLIAAPRAQGAVGQPPQRLDDARLRRQCVGARPRGGQFVRLLDAPRR